jgi:hypothetical protein
MAGTLARRPALKVAKQAEYLPKKLYHAPVQYFLLPKNGGGAR